MKITKTQLRKVIKEELEKTLQEFMPGSMAAQGAQRRAEIQPILSNMGVKDTTGSKQAFFDHAASLYRNRYEMLHSMAATGGLQFGEGDISDGDVKSAFVSQFMGDMMDGESGKLNNVRLSEEQANLVIQYLMNNKEKIESAKYLRKQLNR